MNVPWPNGKQRSTKAAILRYFLIASLGLSGCSHGYVMTLANGNKVSTANKPQLRNGAYIYKDAMGQEVVIPSSRVREITPASMAKEEKSRFSAPPGK